MKYFTALLLLVCPFFLFAQVNYHKGLVTVNDGKVLSGYIDSREWEENPKSIAFKTNLDDKKPQLFFPAEVKTFTIDGFDTYVSYAGKISLSKTRLSELGYERDTTTKFDHVFLMQVTTGDKLTLYSYTDSIKTRLFIQEKQAQPYELAFQEYYVVESSTSTHAEKKYIGQLIYLATKYGSINSQLKNTIERSAYNSSDIEGIVNRVNGIKNTAVKTVVSHTRYFIGAAVNVSKSGFDGNSDFYNSKATTVTPRFNFGVDIFNNANVQQFMLRIELGVSYVNPRIIYSTPPSTSSYSSSQQYNYNQYNATLTPQLIWNVYNKDAFKIYINIGAGFNISTYTNHTRTITQTFTFTSPPSTTVANVSTYKLDSGLWLNFPVQTGVILNKRLELFASYTAPTAYTKYVLFSLSNQTYSAGFHYLFGKQTKK